MEKPGQSPERAYSQLPPQNVRRDLGRAAIVEVTQNPGINEELAKLFYREFAFDYFPPTESDNDNRITATAVDRSSLDINDTHVHLIDHQLFIVNALTYLRQKDTGVARQDIYRLGFSPNASDTDRHGHWSKGILAVMHKLNHAAETDIVSATGSGRWQRYHLNPNFAIVKPDQYTGPSQQIYDFSELIGNSLLALDTSLTIMAGKEAPVPAYIRDNQTIVVNNIATQLNEFDRELLQLFLLNNGGILSLDQLDRVGFCARGTSKWVKQTALRESIQTLNSAFGNATTQPFFYMEKHPTEGRSTVQLLRAFTLHDLRIPNSTNPPLKQATNAFRQLLPYATPDIMSRDEIIDRCYAASGAALSLKQAYALSLHYGEEFPFLYNTHITTKSGLQIAYNDLRSHITPGTPMPLRAAGKLLGFEDDRSIALPKNEALRALQRTEITRPANEQRPERLEKALAEIVRMIRRPEHENRALLDHLLPNGEPPTALDLASGLPWLRKLHTALAATLDEHITVSKELHDYYLTASDYFVELIGNREQKISPQSFDQLAANDAYFAKHGHQLITDFCELLLRYQRSLE